MLYVFQGNTKDKTSSEQLTWPGIYRIAVTVMSTMLGTLRYHVLQDSLDFVGVHQDRMQQVPYCVIPLIDPLK